MGNVPAVLVSSYSPTPQYRLPQYRLPLPPIPPPPNTAFPNTASPYPQYRLPPIPPSPNTHAHFQVPIADCVKTIFTTGYFLDLPLAIQSGAWLFSSNSLTRLTFSQSMLSTLLAIFNQCLGKNTVLILAHSQN